MLKRRRILLFTFLLLFLLKADFCFSFSADVKPICNRKYFSQVRSLISEAEQSIYIILYIARYYQKYPDSSSNRLIRELISAAKRGVDVQVILDRSNWNEKNTAENKATARIFSEGGVRVWLDDFKKTSHNKLIIIDGRYVVIGSTNWSYYALDKNNESSVLIDSPEVADVFKKYFAEVQAKSEKFDASESPPKPSLGKRIRRLFIEER
ncbi:MAG: hypothetical protein B5M48_02060 [Candidatus Omnitrophica bacterium 4484_213]|nr:MAG: hypothetical protein B5M48_02060 [Candidatus Omnitrophica bacterium 4484_213]